MKISQQRLNDKKFFEDIPVNERSTYRKKVTQIRQLAGQQPTFYIKHYQNEAKFDYQGTKLHYYFSEQHPKPRAVLFFFHGMYFHGNTSGYMASIVSKLTKINTYALDFKNAGKSQGDCPGLYQSVQSLVDQAQKFIMFIIYERYIKPQHQIKQKGLLQEPPTIFISGESMGGLITYKLCLKNPQKFKGAILLCPALRDCYENMPILKKVGRFMGYLFPKLKIVPQDYLGMNRYLNLQHIKKDEGRYLGNHPPGSAYCLLKQLDTLSSTFDQMKTPYLCIQGGIDLSVDLFAPLDLQKQSPVKDKTTIYFKDMWHDLLLQQQSKEVCEIVAQWLKERI